MLLTLVACCTLADRGLIPAFPGVELGEPGQRAIIAWDGEEEALILSTDVQANRGAVVVEVLPLPSRPEVEAASSWAFREVQRLLREKAVKAAGLEALEPVRGVEVVLHEEIGVHEVVVVEAHNARELLEWLREYLRERGLNPGFCGVSTGGPCSSDEDCVRSGCSGEVCQSKLEEPVVTPCVWRECYDAERYGARCACVQGRCRWVVEWRLGRLEELLEDYAGRGFQYYAVDIVRVEPGVRSVEPLLYRFNTSFLYYPLKITSALGGETSITLYLPTPWPLQLKPEYVAPLTPLAIHTEGGVKRLEVRLSRGEVARIDVRLAQLLGSGAILTALTYRGPLESLNTDVMVPAPAYQAPSQPPGAEELEALRSEIASLRHLVATLCTVLSAAVLAIAVLMGLIIRRLRRVASSLRLEPAAPRRSAHGSQQP